MKIAAPFFLTCLMLCHSLIYSQIVTNPDSVDVYLNEFVLVDVLANDYEINGDSIFLVGHPSYNVIANKYIRVSPDWRWLGRQGRDTIIYHVKQVNGTNTATGYLYFNVINESFNTLDINNLSARFCAFGTHFSDCESSMFFAPKNTPKTVVFANTLWVGGMEVNTGLLHFSGGRYRGSSSNGDFHAGPVSLLYHSYFERDWNRVWKLTTAEINYHINNYYKPGYVPIRDISEWPAHGDTLNGQLWHMAPFHDRNNDGVYQPMKGDYPLIRGDMALFFVFNDTMKPNEASEGTPLGVEVHGMAYAFDQPGDSMLNNTIFLHYDIINRSSNDYEDAWIGMFTDFNLGYQYDDFVGTDVQNGAVYCYNGTAVDGFGQFYAYGADPPVIGMQFLAGPYLDANGIDNPKTDSSGNRLCDISLNGLNFGDGIPDNERYGMTRSMSFYGIGSFNAMSSPGSDTDYYNYLRGIWKDDTRMLYGGNGHITNSYGPECNFMYPGDSDPCHFGTGGIPPYGPADWTEHNAGNLPYYRRVSASSGPFTFRQGDRHQLDVAFLFARDLVANKPLDTIRDRFGKLKELFENNQSMFDPVLSDKSSLKPEKSAVMIYPNPAADHIIVSGIEINKLSPYMIYNIIGQIVASGTIDNSKIVDISHLKSGIYIISIQNSGNLAAKKFIKH